MISQRNESNNENINESESSGMIVSVRIKPPEENSSNISVNSPGLNLLRITTNSDNHNTYKYDYVHWSTGTSRDTPSYASQETVYNDIGIPLVRNTLQGYNCSLFAYGQTGSGKTYTMFGEENDEGIIPRVCRNLMNRTNENSDNIRISFKITYVEIFLEKVRDLLRISTSSSSSTPTSIHSNSNLNTNTTSLKVREHPVEGPFVEGALCLEIENFEECMNYINIGNRNRMIASTKMNLQSSRSHAIFTLHCTQTKQIEENLQQSHNILSNRSTLNNDSIIEEENTYTITSKLNLVDLAGSENAISAGTEGERLKEGAAINKSLLTLGRVIKILAENATKEKSSPLPPNNSNSSNNIKSNRRHSMLEKSVSDRNLGQSIAINSSTPSPSNSKNNNKRSSLSPQSSFSTLTPPNDDKSRKITPPRSTTSNLTLVPYRDSVLTYLLKESLGGNSKTTMIATIRPGVLYADETASTLRYAAQAKKIVNVVVVNENPYIKMIKKLQKEVEELTRRLASQPVATTSTLIQPTKTPITSSPPSSFASITPIQGLIQDSEVIDNHQPPSTPVGLSDSFPIERNSITTPIEISDKKPLNFTFDENNNQSNNNQNEEIKINNDNDNNSINNNINNETILDSNNLEQVTEEVKNDINNELIYIEHSNKVESMTSNTEKCRSKSTGNDLEINVNVNVSPNSPESLLKKNLTETIPPNRSMSPVSSLSSEPQLSFNSTSFNRNLSTSQIPTSSIPPYQFNLHVTQPVLRKSLSNRSYHNQLQRDYQSPQIHKIDHYIPTIQDTTRTKRAYTQSSNISTSSIQSLGSNPSNIHPQSAHYRSQSFTNQSYLHSNENFQQQNFTNLPPSEIYRRSLSNTSFLSHPSHPSSLYPHNQPSYDDDTSTVTDTVCDPNDVDLADSDEILILKEGFLMKRGYINRAFKRRWCVLRGRQILFYKEYSDQKIRGIINIQSATIEVAEDKKKMLPFAFYLYTPNDKSHSKWLLQAASEDEMLSWINCIQISSVQYAKVEVQENKSTCNIS